MKKSMKDNVLMEEDDIQITTKQVNTPEGEFSLQDIQGVASRTTKPMWGPSLLSILGTLNLAIAFQSGFWLDFAAAGIMLGVGLYWWIQGTRYVLTLTLPKEEVDVWTARHEPQVRQALEILQQSLHKS